MSTSADSEDRILASDDPTASENIRSSGVQQANSRWRDARGAVRSALMTPSGDLREFSLAGGSPPPVGLAAFRRWVNQSLDEIVLDAPSTRTAERGRHWTAGYVADAYRHGLKRADQALEERGYTLPPRRPASVIRDSDHQGLVSDLQLQLFNDVEKAVTDTAQDAVRAYGSTMTNAAGAAALKPLLDSVQDRYSAVGEYRVPLSIETRVVETVNRAALSRYDSAGVESVGGVIEVPEEQQTGSTDRVRWISASDDKVCQTCMELGDSTHKLSDVVNGNAPMPVRDTHVLCRCFTVPI